MFNSKLKKRVAALEREVIILTNALNARTNITVYESNNNCSAFSRCTNLSVTDAIRQMAHVLGITFTYKSPSVAQVVVRKELFPDKSTSTEDM